MRPTFRPHRPLLACIATVAMPPVAALSGQRAVGYSVHGQVDAVRRSFVGTRHDIRSRACQAAMMDLCKRVK